MSKPTSYIQQEGCYSCDLCFISFEHDEYRHFYCTFEAQERPPCGSVAMDEYYGDMVEQAIGLAGYSKAIRKLDDAWLEWSKDKEVKSWGHCGEWILRVSDKTKGIRQR